MKNNNAHKLAQRCAQVMYDNDQASRGLGIELLKVEPGFAKMAMVIQSRMLNGQGLCHGGFIFSLADSTFAFACNSYNHKTVAAGIRIDYVIPAQLGDRLVATATECFRSGRSGIYDVVVCNQHAEDVAFFRGNSRQVKGLLIDEENTTPSVE